MNLSNRVCVSIGTKDQKEILNLIKPFAKNQQLIEIRADYFTDFSIENLNLLFQDLKSFYKDKHLKLIFTCRHLKDGGKFEEPIETWTKIINLAVALGFEYVDIDFSNIQLIDLGKKHPQTKIICSYHNFNHTPGYRNLRKLQKRMRAFKPEIIKFATFSKNLEDNQILLKLLLSKKKKEKMVVVGMGEKGKLTRLIGPLLGSEFTFTGETDSSEKITAPGQVSFSEAITAFNFLKEKNWL